MRQLFDTRLVDVHLTGHVRITSVRNNKSNSNNTLQQLWLMLVFDSTPGPLRGCSTRSPTCITADASFLSSWMTCENESTFQTRT